MCRKTVHFERQAKAIRSHHGAFEEIKATIDAEELPYVDTGDPEDTYEPPFLAEWQNAERAMNITWAACTRRPASEP